MLRAKPPMPRVRWRLWHLMGLVAIVAAGIGVPREWSRRAQYCEIQVILHSLGAYIYKDAVFSGPSELRSQWEEYRIRVIAHHHRMERKWAAAASFPLIPVEADPAAPEWQGRNVIVHFPKVEGRVEISSWFDYAEWAETTLRPLSP